MDKYLETFDAVASIFKSYVPELKIGSTGFFIIYAPLKQLSLSTLRLDIRGWGSFIFYMLPQL